MDSFTLKGTLKNVFSKQMEVQLKKQPIGNSNDMEAQEDRIAIREN
jgi:hypothetical protein